MKRTEEVARRMCAIDLRTHGVEADRIPAIVERFWPVLANEIRGGINVGEWPFTADEIHALAEEYRRMTQTR